MMWKGAQPSELKAVTSRRKSYDVLVAFLAVAREGFGRAPRGRLPAEAKLEASKLLGIYETSLRKDHAAFLSAAEAVASGLADQHFFFDSRDEAVSGMYQAYEEFLALVALMGENAARRLALPEKLSRRPAEMATVLRSVAATLSSEEFQQEVQTLEYVASLDVESQADELRSVAQDGEKALTRVCEGHCRLKSLRIAKDTALATLDDTSACVVSLLMALLGFAGRGDEVKRMRRALRQCKG